MMKFLKKCLSGKSLKLLFGTFLISCFIILVNSSASAGYSFPIGPSNQYSPFDELISINVLPKGSLISNRIGSGKPVLALLSKTSSNGDDGSYMYFRRYNGLPYIYSNIWHGIIHSTSNAYDVIYQGQPSYYYVCPGVIDEDTERIDFGACSLVPIGLGTTSALHGFFGQVGLGDWFYVDYDYYGQAPGRYQAMVFCVSSEEINNTVCFVGGCTPRSSNDRCIELENSLGLHKRLSFEELSDYIVDSTGPGIDNSSSSGGGSNGSGNTVEDEDVIYVYHGSGYRTNEDMMKSYLAMGYYTGLCYGDFNLTSLFVSEDTSNCQGINASYCAFSQALLPNTDCEDGQSYCGASIFDLGTVFNPNMFSSNLGVWFKNVVNLYKSNRNNANINSYVGKPKSLFTIPYKLATDVENGFLAFQPQDYLSFCDMIVNGYDKNAYYTGEQSIYTDEYFSTNTQVILSGADADFSGSKDLFSLFNSLYSNAKNSFKLDSELSSSIPGIIPTYIIFGFMLFLLLYGLKR